MVVTMYSVASRMASLIRLLLYLAAPTACVRDVENLSEFGLSRRFSPGLGVVLRAEVARLALRTSGSSGLDDSANV